MNSVKGIVVAVAIVLGALTGCDPVAIATADPENVTVGEAVSLDGTGSYGLSGLTLTYDWSFDGVPDSSSASDDDITDGDSVNASFVADAAGQYTITLQVRNVSGRTDEDSVLVTSSEQLQGDLETDIQ